MQSHRDRRRAAGKGGFTLMEVSLAIAVIVIALLALCASTLRTHSLRRQNREKAVAQNAVRMISEQIQSFSERLHREDPARWSTGMVAALSPGGALSNEFAVPELTRMAGAPAVGRIQLITDETESDEKLGVEMGMPRDLNGDGDANDVDVSEDARMLPVIVSTRWRGVSGNNFIRHPFYVIRY